MRLSGILILIAVVSGCGRGETNEQRLKRLVPNAPSTTKVSGIVTVDDAPVKDLWVTLHSKDGTVQQRPRAQTDAQGRFQLSTFMKGDGAPAGEYAVTIEWLTHTRVDSSRWIGPDKLLNQYNNPKTTPFQATVKDTPLTLSTFQLKLKGVEAKPKSTGRS